MKEEILKLRAAGKSYNEIQKILGCSKGLISYHCGEGQKEKYIEYAKNSRVNRRNKLNELKNFPCLDCGIKYHPAVMEWDHIGTDKIADISRLIRRSSWQVILDEIAKCELVCANCHRMRTVNRGTAT